MVCINLRLTGSDSHSMPKANKRESVWPFFSGVVIADLNILLIGLEGWDALIGEARILIYVTGSLLLLCGLFLIWKDAIEVAAARHELIVEYEGTYLGRFQLNDYLLQAYERNGEEAYWAFFP